MSKCSKVKLLQVKKVATNKIFKKRHKHEYEEIRIV